MQIKNPSNNAITDVRIFGVSYSIEAEGTLDNVPEEHARYWQENLHKFLVLRKDKREEPKVEEEVVEVPKPKVEEVSAVSVQEPEKVEEALNTEVEVTSATLEVSEDEVAPAVVEKPKGRPKKVK